MISIFLTRTGDDRGVWLRLPSSPGGIGEAYTQLDQFAGPDSHALVTQVKGAEGFQDYLKGCTTDDPEQLWKLNEFANRLDGYSTMQWDLLNGALASENSETIEDVLQVMEHLDQYQALPNIYDATELGHYLVEEGVIQVDRAAWQYLDYAKVGAQYEQAHPGAYIDGFYVCKRDEAVRPYHPLPRQPVFDLRLYTSHIGDTRPGPYRLTLPASEEQLDRAVKDMGVTLFDDCRIEHWECQIPGLAELLPDTVDDIEAMNELASEIVAMQACNGSSKLMAVLEVERPDTFVLARDFAMELENYELCDRDICSASHYGEHVLYDSGRDEDDFEFKDEVRDFINFEEYGEYRMQEDGVRNTEYGLLRRISEPFPPERQEQSQTPCL